jgi:hypothetical protein
LPDSPIFARTYDMLLWLVPRTLKFPRQYRFNLAQRIHDAAHALQRTLLEAALVRDPQEEKAILQRADVELSALRLHVRLSHDLELLDRKGYRHASEMLAEIGRLLGGWQRKNREGTGTEGQS